MAVLREGIFNTLSFAGDYAAQRLRLMRNMITPLHGKRAFPFAHRSRQALHNVMLREVLDRALTSLVNTPPVSDDFAFGSSQRDGASHQYAGSCQ